MQRTRYVVPPFPARSASTRASLVDRMRDSAMARWSSIVAASLMAWTPMAQAAETDLSDQPARTTLSVPANVLLALSVEWPTGNVQAYNDETSGTGCPGRDGVHSVCYFQPSVRATRMANANAGNPSFKPQASMPYLGYFDPFKCYTYNGAGEYFEPLSVTEGYDGTRGYRDQPPTSTARCTGPGLWSGNFLNWATMQTTDLFRWVMTGGDRAIDTESLTVLEKARHDGQGGTAQFPDKRIGKSYSNVPITQPSEVTSYTSKELYVKVEGLNTSMRVSKTSSFKDYDEYKVRVKVCDPSLGETVTTCTAYSAGTLKPTGLIQANAMDVRFAAMGYLLDDDIYRDGGVLRARMKFVGPRRPVLGPVGETGNASAEWDAHTGIYITNPDPGDAAATTGTIT